MIVAVEQKLAIAALNHGFRVGLNLCNDAQDLCNLCVQGGLSAEEDVAVWVGGLVAIVHQLGAGANLAVVAVNQLENTQDGAFVNHAEDEGRSGRNQVLLHILTEADEAHLEVLGLRLLDLSEVEVDEAHGKHVIGEKGELVLAVGVVGGCPKNLNFEK